MKNKTNPKAEDSSRLQATREKLSTAVDEL